MVQIDSKNIRYVDNSDKVNFKPEPGTWIGIDVNGDAVAWNDIAGGGLALVVAQVGDVYTNDDIKGFYICDKIGTIVTLGLGSFTQGMASITLGEKFKVYNGKLALGVAVNSVAELVSKDVNDASIKIRIVNTEIGGIVGTVIDPAIDENSDGVVTRSEIADFDNDSDNDWHDIAAVASGNVVD